MKINRFKISLIALFASIFPWTIAYSQTEFEAFMAEQQQGVQQQKQEFEQYKKEIEAGFAAYKKAYEEEFAAYKQGILQQWGEYRDAGPKTWVSYAEDDQVRRTVDFEKGEVEVDLLVPKGSTIKSAAQRVGGAVYTLLNSTEADAWENDSLAQRVESRLMQASDLLQQDKPTQRRLFSITDLTALNFRGPYQYASNKPTTAIQWDVQPSKIEDADVVTARFVIPNSVRAKAMRYVDDVSEAAKKEELSPALIFAVIQTESSFNPMARSHIPAYGLMQIVPTTSGRDASRRIYGKMRILAPSYLYKVENNIKVGAAYLHMLYYGYVKKVENPVSRLYCAIAAYNTGASNVGKAFIGRRSFSAAVDTINQMTPDQVYQTLIEKLPSNETRQYMKKVTESMREYM
jgi:membrane-bound lytic murein transglycosylase C